MAENITKNTKGSQMGQVTPKKRNFKYFLKQTALKGDVNYCINYKVSIFYE
jgi:hypothetical protein